MLINRPLSLVVCLTVALALGACQEQLRGGNACPSLCPEQQLGFRDTVFEASEVIDTAMTLPGIPSIGTETQLLVARYAQTGDSVVSYAVFRFDSLIRKVPQADTLPVRPFVSVDSSFISLYILPPPVGQDTFYIQDTVTFLLYDVFVDAPDLDTSQVHARFTGTPVASATFSRDSINGIIRSTDPTLKLRIDTLWMTQQITSGKKIWLGLEAVSKKNVQLAFASTQGAQLGNGKPVYMNYLGHDSTHDTVSIVTAAISLATPYGPRIPYLEDYQLTVTGSPAVPAGLLAVGGMPNNRTIIRFKFPAWLVDSSATVVRANLELHQASFTGFQADSDSLLMQPLVAVAGPAVTDLSKIGILLLDQVSAGQIHTAIKTSLLAPASTSLDTIALVHTGVNGIPQNVFTYWRIKKNAIQRAIVLTLALGEGVEPRQLLFYGPSAPLALRPRVHVSYVPHATIGLP